MTALALFGACVLAFAAGVLVALWLVEPVCGMHDEPDLDDLTVEGFDGRDA